MMKFGNSNFKEGLVKRIGTLVLAGTMTVTMCGCGESRGEKEKNKTDTLYHLAMQYTTIPKTLAAIGDLTEMDEFLKGDKFVNRSDGVEYTFDELLKLYDDAYWKHNISECNILLYKIGRMIMKSQIAEALNIEPKQINSLDIDVKSTGANKVKITYNGTQKLTIYLSGELSDLAINILRACNYALQDSSELDAVYESFIEHLLTETIVEKKLFRDEYYIGAYVSDEKKTAFLNEHNSNARSSSSKYGYKYNGEYRGISLCDAIREKKQEQGLNMQSKAMGSYNARRLHR